jgi:hypothetical protein
VRQRALVVDDERIELQACVELALDEHVVGQLVTFGCYSGDVTSLTHILTALAGYGSTAAGHSASPEDISLFAVGQP